MEKKIEMRELYIMILKAIEYMNIVLPHAS